MPLTLVLPKREEGNAENPCEGLVHKVQLTAGY